MFDLASISVNRSCAGSGFLALDIVMDERNRIPFINAGGSCGNVLSILSFLGWTSYPIIRLGKDEVGNRIVQDLKRWGVNVAFIDRDNTIRSPIVIERLRKKEYPTHIFEMKCPSCGNKLPRRTPILLRYAPEIISRLPESDVFYFDRISSSIIEMARHHRKQGALIFFEPSSFSGSERFKDAIELAHIVKHCYNKNITNEFDDAQIEVQTMGNKGLQYRTNLWNENRKWITMKPFSVSNLVDAAGLGDWCSAGIIHSISSRGIDNYFSKSSFELSLKLGQCFAAINCNFEGARGAMYRLRKREFVEITNLMMQGSIMKKIIDIKPTINIRKQQNFLKYSSNNNLCFC